jgi:hypothetical protein
MAKQQRLSWHEQQFSQSWLVPVSHLAEIRCQAGRESGRRGGEEKGRRGEGEERRRGVGGLELITVQVSI